jgi:hypothetical protein
MEREAVGTRFARSLRTEEVMAHAISTHPVFSRVGRFLEHALAVIVGFIMMVVGLGLGVTMIMLPVGIPIGLMGMAIFIGGLFARGDEM